MDFVYVEYYMDISRGNSFWGLEFRLDEKRKLASPSWTPKYPVSIMS